MSRESIGVMHLVDSLSFGGTEKVAVTLSASLPTDTYRPFLCSTREAGPLASEVPSHVPLLCLKRQGRFDWNATKRFVQYLKQNDIKLLHAHSSSLFFAKMAATLSPSAGVRIIWHDHYGSCEVAARSALPYRLATRGIGGVIAVNDLLAGWARGHLGVPPDRVWYLPNFVNPPDPKETSLPVQLPGYAGTRIICVANLRPQKDHLTLVEAMKLVVRRQPKAQLLLLGSRVDEHYANSVSKAVADSDLSQNISFLGPQSDVAGYLSQCDLGVLSSASEGLPLSLLEYGWAGLPVVATRVGQCAEVLDGGRVGLLVDSGNREALAECMIQLLENPQERRELGGKFRSFVEANYSRHRVITSLCEIYSTVLGVTL